MTLRQLWRMANGRMKQQRMESLQLVCLAFNNDLDSTRFLETGQMAETTVGKPIRLRPELEEQVQAEVARIRKENPHLPQIAAIR